MKSELQARNLEAKTGAENVAAGLDGKTVIVLRQASETGQLYGSVSTRDIAGLLNADGGSQVSRGQVELNTPIKSIGQYKVPLALHAEVETVITVIVARSNEEAERIARGENVLIPRDEAEEQAAQALATAESFFEEGVEQDEEEGEGRLRLRPPTEAKTHKAQWNALSPLCGRGSPARAWACTCKSRLVSDGWSMAAWCHFESALQSGHQPALLGCQLRTDTIEKVQASRLSKISNLAGAFSESGRGGVIS